MFNGFRRPSPVWFEYLKQQKELHKKSKLKKKKSVTVRSHKR